MFIWNRFMLCVPFLFRIIDNILMEVKNSHNPVDGLSVSNKLPVNVPSVLAQEIKTITEIENKLFEKLSMLKTRMYELMSIESKKSLHKQIDNLNVEYSCFVLGNYSGANKKKM